MKLFFLFFILFLSLINLSRANTIGVGATLGQPTGLTSRFWQGNNRAWDAGAAWSFGGDNPNFNIYGGHIWNKEEVLYTENNKPLDVYYGAGLRMKFAQELELGLRLPLGMSYFNSDRKFEWFGELAPIFDFASHPKTEIHLFAGARFYFDK